MKSRTSSGWARRSRAAEVSAPSGSSSLVGARPRVERRPVGVDQDVTERALEGVDQLLAVARQLDRDPVERAVPLRDGRIEGLGPQALGVLAGRRGRQRRTLLVQRQNQEHVPLLPGGEIELVLERARGIAEVVDHRGRLGQRAATQELGDAAVLEARRAEPVGAAQRDHMFVATDGHPAVGIGQLRHADRAPARAQRLPGRVDPEQAQRQEQPTLERRSRLVADPVPQPEGRAAEARRTPAP